MKYLRENTTDSLDHQRLPPERKRHTKHPRLAEHIS